MMVKEITKLSKQLENGATVHNVYHMVALTL